MKLGKPDFFLKFDTLEEARKFLGTSPTLSWRDSPIRKDGLIKEEDDQDEPRPETKEHNIILKTLDRKTGTVPPKSLLELARNVI